MAFTHAKLAKLLDVSESTISFWKRKGCPVRGTLDQVKKWREEFDATNVRKQGPSIDPLLRRASRAEAVARAQERTESAKIRKIDRLAKERALVPIEEVRKLISKISERSRALALAIPKNRAKDFLGIATTLDAERKLDQLVRDVLAAIAEAAPKPADR
jgi:phage terminase Nu1 subunit (DNA packaging protein)